MPIDEDVNFKGFLKLVVQKNGRLTDTIVGVKCKQCSTFMESFTSPQLESHRYIVHITFIVLKN